MTDKEAIERLKRIDIRFFLSGMNEQSNYIVDEADKVNKAIETVLNLLQTQQTETLEYKKTITQDNKEYEHMKKSLKGIISRSNAEIEKKDEIIDLMAEWLYEDDTSFGYGNLKDVNTSEKIKQYFERKVENGN